jgi:multisubunit Na+/H+ antiporter MnhB subunit
VVETWKAIAAYLGWLLAAASIAILGGLLAGEVVLFVGLVDPAGSEQKLVVEAVGIVLFVMLAALPYLLRHRVLREEAEPGEE